MRTFYGFCDAFLTSRGQRPDFRTMNTDPNFWLKVQEKVMAERIPAEWMFDSLIVDEGQDFESDWFEILRLFLREDANILWLEDTEQNLWDRERVLTEGFVS